MRMLPLSSSRIRQFARRIAPLYWFVGVVRYVIFRARLRAEKKRYARGHFAHLPPPFLRHRVHGALDPESYTNAGKVLATRIVESLREHGMHGGSIDVLDFACGPGRIAAEVKRLERSWQIYGCDIDDAAIAWATANLAGIADFSVNAGTPPTRFKDDQFDAIYSISLFTHLDEPSQNLWLAELSRIAKPGGLAVLTVHGARTWGSCTGAERERIAADGFLFRVDRTGSLKLDGLPDGYQTTFHSRAYVEGVWTRWLEILSYQEGGLEGHQDLIVLRKLGRVRDAGDTALPPTSRGAGPWESA